MVQSYKPEIGIVVLNWNGLPDTLKCVDSLLKLNYKNCRIFVVDNNSAENESSRLKENFGDQIEFVQNSQNLGYCGGNNSALKFFKDRGLSFDYYLILNNDTVVEPNLIDKLLDNFSSNTNLAIVSPAILNFNNHQIVDTLGLTFSLWTGISIAIGHGQELKKVERKKAYSISGTCFLIKSSIVDELGYLFDEDYFCYFEETDLSARIRRLGYDISINYDAAVYHKGSITSDKISGFAEFQLIRNRFLIIHKNANFLQKIVFLLLTTILYLPYRLLVLHKSEKKSSAQYFLAGFRAGLRLFFGGAIKEFGK